MTFSFVLGSSKALSSLFLSVSFLSSGKEDNMTVNTWVGVTTTPYHIVRKQNPYTLFTCIHVPKQIFELIYLWYKLNAVTNKTSTIELIKY